MGRGVGPARALCRPVCSLSVGFQVKCAILRCEEGRCSTRDAPIVPEILRRSCRKSHKPCADPHGWGDRWGGLARGTQAWEDPTRPIKEHAVSDRRRVCGTIRAAFMDNGATHLESYTYDQLHHSPPLPSLPEITPK